MSCHIETFLYLSLRKRTIVIIVRRPLSVVNFSHFRLLLWNRWSEFNETCQETRSQRPLLSLCFSGWSEKQYGRPGLWLAETFSTSPLKLLNRIQRNLTGIQISTSSAKFVFFGPIGKKTRLPPWPLIGWDISDFYSETAERNSTKLDRKQDLNVPFLVCVFRADRKKDGSPGLWLAETFRLLLWNRWTEFNETWQETRSQSPLPSLCFWADWKNKMAALASDWLRHFRLLLWNPWIWRNLSGSKISTSFTKFVFFGPIGKTRWPPWPIRQKGGTLYSGARYVALWASCFLKTLHVGRPWWALYPLQQLFVSFTLIISSFKVKIPLQLLNKGVSSGTTRIGPVKWDISNFITYIAIYHFSKVEET